jgi:hypothetical protein
MNTYRKAALIFASFVVVAALMPVPGARAQLIGETVHVTFSKPVELPGKVLPAGSYIFKAIEDGQVTQVLSADEMHLYATLFTVPNQLLEVAEKPEVTLRDNPNGGPERVDSWFYPGDTIGHEFVYPKEHSGKGLTSKVEMPAKESAHAVEYVGVHAEHVVVESGHAIERGLRHVVS